MTRPSGTLIERTVAVVLAGGKGTRLDPLTREICKPALPFGGTFRCIDFSLSNCLNSGLRRIAVLTQHKPDALLAHLWSRWNSVAGGDAPVIRAWRAEERAERFGCCGTADAVYRNLASIRDLQDSLVLVLAGDHVYKMDYRPLLEAHVARNAGVTIGCIEVPLADARRLGCCKVGGHARIERFVEKPQALAEVGPRAANAVASMGIYVFDGAVLAPLLAADAELAHSGHDFAADILPRLVDGGRAYSYDFRPAGNATSAYWRDIGTLQSYWHAHLELLGPRPLFTLDDATWPIGRVAAAPRSITRAAATAAGGTVTDSIVAANCHIAGSVLRSVLSDDVEIGRDATVAETVLLPGARVGAGSLLHGAIVDAGYHVPDGTVIERCAGDSEPPVLSVHGHRSTPRTIAR